MKEREEISVANGVRPGLTSITPYLVVHGAVELLEFLKVAFDATERLRVPTQDGRVMHAEVALGNGAIEVSDGAAQFEAAPSAIHLYVKDADAIYTRAIAAGATSIYAVADQEWGDRQGAVRDAWGNHWYIAKAGDWAQTAEAVPSVQPFLHLHAAQEMFPFLEKAFEAEALGVAKSPEGAVLHGTIRIGNATLEIDEAHGEFQPMPCHLHVYVANTDAAYARALAAGATSLKAPMDEPYGDRAAAVKDMWGISWFLATYLGK